MHSRPSIDTPRAHLSRYSRAKSNWELPSCSRGWVGPCRGVDGQPMRSPSPPESLKASTLRLLVGPAGYAYLPQHCTGRPFRNRLVPPGTAPCCPSTAHRLDVARVYGVPHNPGRALVRAQHGAVVHGGIRRPRARIRVVHAVRRRDRHCAAHHGGAAAEGAAPELCVKVQHTAQRTAADVRHLLYGSKGRCRTWQMRGGVACIRCARCARNSQWRGGTRSGLKCTACGRRLGGQGGLGRGCASTTSPPRHR